ncbi:MAG: ABC transporter permease [Acidimicrobiia bacterium]|nr:ABC transporter permease [Acidimicrobiia bacterium]NNL27846.1 ABC transporter permease [Acidimicrobiia bacterium]
MARELTEQLKSKAFQISTAVFVIGILAAMVIPTIVDDSVDRVPVAVTGSGSAEIMLQLSALGSEDEVALGIPVPGSGIRFEPREVSTRTAAVEAVESGAVRLAIVDGREIISMSQPGATGDLVEQLLYSYEVADRFTRSGISSIELLAITTVEPPTITILNDDADESNAVLSYVSSTLLYITIITYGLSVAMSVVNEKSSRVVEIVLSTIRSVDLLAGKVLGVGATGLIQVLAIIGVALVTIVFTENLPIPDTGGVLPLLTVAMWFLLGYTFYAAVYAVIGSTISKIEDLQGVAFPAMVPILIGFFISFSALEGEETLAMEIASFIPFTAPLTMPPRMLLGFAAPWEVLVSVALQVIGIWVVLRFAAKAFSGGLLADRIRLREVFKTS